MSYQYKYKEKYESFDNKLLKKHAIWIKVTGAYVAEPTPGIYGLDDKEVIMSNDATSLYPTSEILSNIGYETLWGRIYDVGIIDNVINLLLNIEKQKNINILPQAVSAFENAFKNLLKNYTKIKSVSNKSEFIEVNLITLTYFFEKIAYFISSKGNLSNIWNPETDEEYFLLKSYFFPLVESIHRISDKNRGYSKVIIDWVYHHELFDEKYKNKYIFYFENINSTKTKFKYIKGSDFETTFSKYLLNPYGTVFLKHKTKLAYTVQENISGLSRRKKIKNPMLCLNGLVSNFDLLDENDLKIFLDKKENEFKLTEEEIRQLYSKIDKDEGTIKWRIDSLKDFVFQKKYNDKESLKNYLDTRAQQLDNVQLGIKVTLNSGYGINGLISYVYANPLVANSITTTGKIYGIKTFQRAVIEELGY